MSDGYIEYEHYLSDELGRVARLVAAYFLRQPSIEFAQATVVESLVQCPLKLDHTIVGSEVPDSWQDCLNDVRKSERDLVTKLNATSAETRGMFPLCRLIDAYKLRRELSENWIHTEPELDALLVALLEHRSPTYRAAFNSLRTEDGAAPGGLTAAMLAEIVQPVPPTANDPTWDRLAIFDPAQPLVRDSLLAFGDDSVHASHRRVQIDGGIAAFLLGDAKLDQELRIAAKLYCPIRRDAPTLHVADEILGQLDRFESVANTAPRPLILLLHGPAGGPFLQVVRSMTTAASEENARPLLVVDVARAPTGADWSKWAARLYLVARLRRAAVFWNGASEILDNFRTDARWIELVHPPADVLTFIAAKAAWDPVDAAHVVRGTFARIELPIQPQEIRRDIWEERLGQNFWPGEIPQDLSLDLLPTFQFTEGQIVEAITVARGLAATAADQSHAANHLFDACRRVSAGGLVSFTQRIQPRPALATLGAVVLADEAKQQLKELDDRIRTMSEIYYGLGFGDQLSLGKGLVALFSGPSGTGKTLAAMVLASCSQRDLYKVDMAAVVSKYVGETEKNLARVFTEAQSANALLFFDEADAIFGKRGEVDRAQDRWANMEINFLLQRVEEFAGVVILATNLRQNIDEAFYRRVQVLIEFRPPDAELRRSILSAMFPVNVIPPSNDELTKFASRFDLTGGNLKNIALDAAFRAYHEDPPLPRARLRIKLTHLVLATAREYRKLGRPVTIASFDRDYFEIVKAAGFKFD